MGGGRGLLATMATLGEEPYIVMDQDTVMKAAVDNPVYQLLLSRVADQDGLGSRSQELACLCPFYNIKDRLAAVDGLIHL